MAWLTHLIFLSFLHLFRCDCVLNHQSLEEAWEKQLHKDLMKGYDWSENPNTCNVTEVKIKFLMKSFNLDSDTEIFTMYSIMIVSWTDERLKWNPSDYGGLTESYFFKMEHWVPFVEWISRTDYNFGLYYGECNVENTGYVVCSPRVLVETQCTTKMSNWPYDTQTCALDFTISEYQKDVHLIPKGKRAVSMGGAGYGPEFTIVDYHQISNTSDKVQLRMTFVLDRNGEHLASVIVFPAILLSILTASSIILDVSDRKRLLMTLFSMLCHCFYLSEMGWEIPKHSVEPPTILLFYRSSMLLTMFLVFATVILGKLRNKETAPPAWVSSVYSIVLNSHGKYFIWPRWKTNIELLTSEDVDVKSVEVWNGFANIVNSVCFFFSVIVYSIIISMCVPKQQPFT